MAEHRADEPERDRRHDDERLRVRAKRDREQAVDHEHRDRPAAPEIGEEFRLFALLAAEGHGHVGVGRGEIGEHAGLERRDDLVRVGERAVDLGRHGDDAASVLPLDRRVPLAEFGARDRGERHGGAVAAAGCACPRGSRSRRAPRPGSAPRRSPPRGRAAAAARRGRRRPDAPDARRPPGARRRSRRPAAARSRVRVCPRAASRARRSRRGSGRGVRAGRRPRSRVRRGRGR